MEKLLLVAQIIRVLIDIMKAIEDAIPGQGVGEQKLAAVRAIFENTVDAADKLWPTAEKVIPILVKLFNSTKAW